MFTISLSAVDRRSLLLVGGKGANLGELKRAGLPVPDGFCLTTDAFREFADVAPGSGEIWDQLDMLHIADPAAVMRTGEMVRAALRELPFPANVQTQLSSAWQERGDDSEAYAVRSSATAEDLPGASFAGQHDTFLNVRSEEQLLAAVRRCWISLFTDRAIVYRARHGFDHRRTSLAVVVQRMVTPEVAGVAFTADPITGHRRVTVVNASYGLGESVVAGLVNPDMYQIDPDGALQTTIADKRLMVVPDPHGGVAQQTVPGDRRRSQALPDSAIMELTQMCRRIARHFDSPQDIEWAWVGGKFHILQSRPITSLFPLPERSPDERLHVYFSFGHQQMMTEAIKPLGLSVLRTFFPFGRRGPDGESSQLVPAAGRLFFDYTDPLHHRVARTLLARAAGAMDPRVGRAVLDVARRADFRAHQRFNPVRQMKMNVFIVRTVARVVADLCWGDMTSRLASADKFMHHTLAGSRAALGGVHGADRISRIQQDLREVPLQLYFELTLTQVTAMISRVMIERLGQRWLGAAPDLSAIHRSLPGNVTTEMGMAIGDLADLARGRPELLALLQSPPEGFTLDGFDTVPGGSEFRIAFTVLLERYGMRGAGEIDITRPRWSEQPTQLFSGILANTRKGEAGEQRQRFRTGEKEAHAAIDVLVGAVRAAPFGTAKAATMKRLLTVFRTLMALREHQKFLTVAIFDGYRGAIRAEAQAMTDAGVLSCVDDADFLSLHELKQLLSGRTLPGLAELVTSRRREHAAHQRLTPPRLFTSDGEIVNGTHGGSPADGVLIGCPVSAGVAEGLARVVLRPEDADLRDGDILVAPSTDPAWTPLFSAVRGIVLEIGGVMSHGAVVARELGLPTVVGVDDATRLIVGNSSIRVDGTAGLVEPLGQRADDSSTAVATLLNAGVDPRP